MKKKAVKKKDLKHSLTKDIRIQQPLPISHLSEINARIIINKLISKAVYQSFTTSIQNQTGEACNQYLKNSIHPLLQLEYLHHDNDNLYLSPDHWIGIDEVKKPIGDRDAYSLIKFERFKIEQKVIIEHPEETNRQFKPRDTQSNSTHPNTLKPVRTNYYSKTNFNKTSTKDIVPRSKESQISGLIGLFDNNAVVTPNKKKEKALVIDIPSTDITNIDSNRLKELKNAAELRIEKEKELIDRIKSKEEEKKRLIEIERKKNAEKEASKVKEFNMDKHTFDSNGNVINYKYISKERLGDDFTTAKCEQKQISVIREKPIRYDNENETHANTNTNTKASNKKKEEAKIEVNLTQEQKLRLLFAKNNTTNHPSMANKAFIGRFDGLNHPTHIAYCPPSGNNFSLFSPEIGVIIHNEAKEVKSGSLDFVRKYNRLSMYEFQMKANDNITTLESRTNQMMDNNNNTTEMTNILQTRNMNKMTVSNTDCTNNQSNEFNSNNNNNKRKKQPHKGLHSSSSYTQIRMNTQLSNLKMAFDTLDNVFKEDQRSVYRTQREDLPTIVVFKKDKKNNLITVESGKNANDTVDLNEVDKFTKNIVKKKAGEWGEVPFAKYNPQLDKDKKNNKRPVKSSSMKDIKNKIILKPIQGLRVTMNKRRASPISSMHKAS